MTEEASITITVSADLDFKVSEIWPDGDAPEVITAADVAAVIKRSYRLTRWLSDWNVERDVSVEVYVVDAAPNPHHGQVESLIPDMAPSAPVGGSSYSEVAW